MDSQNCQTIPEEKNEGHLAKAEILGGGGVFCPHCGYYTDCVWVDEEIECEICRKIFVVTGKVIPQQ